ncbi:glycolipid transfer protein domain-containing protein [Cladochytrium replicatum]|nr:glycolipid transfer protein domain-containing protein [Cladochytrium replicatum]
MATFFDTAVRRYNEVPIGEEGIDVVTFLESTEALIKMFDILHPTAFAPVKSDMNGNVTKIRERFLVQPVAFNTLQKLVVEEVKEKKNTATVGLVWLNRGLTFTSQALRRNVDNPNEELKTSFQKAYEVTLSRHHSFLVRPIFSLAMNACPYRKDFYAKLGTDQAKVEAQMNEWLAALENCVAIITAFLNETGYEKTYG